MKMATEVEIDCTSESVGLNNILYPYRKKSMRFPKLLIQWQCGNSLKLEGAQTLRFLDSV